MVGALRHDALFYCLSALQRFAGMTKEALSPVVLEMATLGQSGLKVNDPEPQYHLRLVPGDFSGLQIVCMMHVGLKQLDPSMDAGMDLDREYEAAHSLFARNNPPCPGGVAHRHRPYRPRAAQPSGAQDSAASRSAQGSPRWMATKA